MVPPRGEGIKTRLLLVMILDDTVSTNVSFTYNNACTLSIGFEKGWLGTQVMSFLN